MSHAKCELCETNRATLIKYEAELDCEIVDGEEREIVLKVAVKICAQCSEDWYDGTEEFPQTYPLD
jgi:hypothetical protein